MIDDRNLSAGLVVRSELRSLGQSIADAWPVDQSQSFSDLLEAIDEADGCPRPAFKRETPQQEVPGRPGDANGQPS